MAIKKNSDGKTSTITRSAGEGSGSATPNRVNSIPTPRSDGVVKGRVRKAAPARQRKG